LNLIKPIIKLYLAILVILEILFANCAPKASNQCNCELDSIDYRIYSILIDRFVFKEIDSTLSFDKKRNRVIVIKNPKRNLLLIDSSRIVLAKTNSIFLNADFLLALNFKIENSFSCKIDSGFHQSIKFYPIHPSINKGKHRYEDLYSKYKDAAGIVAFSKIGYSANRTKALVEICFYNSPLNSFGLFAWLELKKGEWVVVEYKSEWIS